VNIIVSISDAKISRDGNDTIVTYSLGSCIGVAMFDPVAKVGGMLHFQLPSATMDQAKATANPNMFGDSGTAALLKKLESMGANRRRMKVKIAGGATMLNDNSMFNIGRRNHAAIRKILWQYGLLLDGEDVGGSAPRNMYLKISDGAVSTRVYSETRKI
jgi:chemotaxis protein CheD